MALATVLGALCLLSPLASPGISGPTHARTGATSLAPVLPHPVPATRSAQAPSRAQLRPSFAVGLSFVTPNGVGQPATLPTWLSATATPSDPMCTSGFSYVFDWGDGSPKTTDANGTDRHWYVANQANANGIQISVIVTDCQSPAGTGTTFAQPTFYPAVSANLTTDLGSSSLIQRNASVLHLNLTVVNITGGITVYTGNPYFINWSFGDGSRAWMIPEPASLAPLPEFHSFLRPSSASGPVRFVVVVSVTDRLNGNSTTQLTVQLNGTPPVTSHPPGGGIPTTYLYAGIAGAAVVVVLIAVVVLRRRKAPSPKSTEEEPGAEASEGSEGGFAGAPDRRAEGAGGSVGAAAASSPGTTPDTPVAAVASTQGKDAGPVRSPSLGTTGTSSFGSPGRPSGATTAALSPSSTTPGSMALVPCIICGTPLPSVDSPCPKCSPGLFYAASKGGAGAEPQAPVSPPLPGLGSGSITPPPIHVGPSLPVAAPAPDPSPIDTPHGSPTAHEPGPSSISYVPTAPVPELEPLPVTRAPAGPEPDVDTTPVVPLPRRPPVNEQGANVSRTASDSSFAPASGSAETSPSSTPASTSTPSQTHAPSSPPVPASTPYLFPVSQKALFETLVAGAPDRSQSATTAPGGTETASAPTATGAAPASPPTPPSSRPSADVKCMICGGPLQSTGFCPACKMNWRE